MASSEADIALRKIDLTEPGPQEPYNIDTSASEAVLSRLGTVVGADVGKIKSYVTQAQS